MAPSKCVIMHEGRCMPLEKSKIDDAVFAAALAAPGCDLILATILADELAQAVTMFLERNCGGCPLHVEDVYDTVEKVLTEIGHEEIAASLNVGDFKPAGAHAWTRWRRTERAGPGGRTKSL